MNSKVKVTELVEKLRTSTNSSVDILTDENNVKFQECMVRWSDIDKKTPAAIILPTSEDQIQHTIRTIINVGVPFVIASGGHSTWSTIGNNGVIIDLSNYWGLEVNAREQTAVIRGSVLSKQLSVALAKEGLFTAVGAGNSIGAIGYFLCGGTSPLNSVTGYGSDQILSARMIDSWGNTIQVTEEKEPELLWAIRGAGQYFGLITELTIKCHALEKLGNSQGTIWAGRFVFPLERAAEVTTTMSQIVNDESKATNGMILIMSPPPDRKHCIVVSGRYIGDPDDAQIAYQPLYDLNPLMATGDSISIQNMNDAHKITEIKGGYTRYGVVGLRRFDVQGFLKVVELWKKLVNECPDAANTSFNFQWDSRLSKQPLDSANSLDDLHFWQNNLLWYSNSASQEIVNRSNDEANSIMRGPNKSEFADFQNGTREGPIEYRFRPDSKLQRLKSLKQKWDPNGVFTKVLLD